MAILVAGTLLSGAAGAQGAVQWQSLPSAAPAPADNPTTQAKVRLGKMLFFDPRFSSTGTVSCFSCHNVMEGGDDHRPVSIGVEAQRGGRNAPTVFNAAFLSVQFWDGRAATLEDQAKGPPVNPIEMGMKGLTEVIYRIQRIPGYRPYFEQAFGSGDVVTMDNAAKAIAAYERTLITPGSAYDRYVEGDHTALTAQQVRGMSTFAAVGCASCHQGPNLSGPALPTSQGFFMKFPVYPQSPYVAKYDLMKDSGRYEATHNPADRNLWRVPGLRNLAYTAPYMHNGSVKSLPEAVRVMASAQLNRTLTAQQVGDITAFLQSLTGPFPKQTMPRLPPTPGNLLAR
ncbi:MAG: c-type cytochrome [Gammaproteobacteria bacterium]|nr:c-type cytochrome [Gammaproteobacteria bacterium]